MLLNVALMLLLIGCATVISDSCPRQFSYTQAQLDQAAGALRGTDDVIVQMIEDYGIVREENRVCRGEK